MPANLSPEYKAAELHYRQARDPKERLQWLREMLRVIGNRRAVVVAALDFAFRHEICIDSGVSPSMRPSRRSPFTTAPTPDGVPENTRSPGISS